MFIPIITKPVFIPFIQNADGWFEVCFKGHAAKVCPQQFTQLFPDISKNVRNGVAKMDKACAENFFEQIL